MSRVSLTILIFISLWSCGDQKIDTTKAREEMEAREIKVVSEAEIMDKAKQLGNQLSKAFQLEKEGEELKVSWAEDLPHEITYYLFDGEKPPEGKTFELFDAYLYNQENGLESEANVQRLDNATRLLYTAPMKLEDSTIGMWAITFSRKEIVLNMGED